MTSTYSIYVSVDIASATKTDDESDAAWRQVNRHLAAASKGIPGLLNTGSGTGFGCRDADYECEDRAAAERFKTRLGSSMTVRLGAREVALPVTCGIMEHEFADVFVAETAPGRVGLDWRDDGSVCRDYEGEGDFVALVKVWRKAKRSEVAAALRHLADQLESAPSVDPGGARSGPGS